LLAGWYNGISGRNVWERPAKKKRMTALAVIRVATTIGVETALVIAVIPIGGMSIEMRFDYLIEVIGIELANDFDLEGVFVNVSPDGGSLGECVLDGIDHRIRGDGYVINQISSSHLNQFLSFLYLNYSMGWRFCQPPI
jgi:hypothetical protein